MGRGASDERLRPTVVVIKLDKDSVEADGAVEHLVIGGVGVRALRGGREEPFLPGAGGVGVHEGAELVREGGDVVDRCLKVEVEAIDGGGAKGA